MGVITKGRKKKKEEGSLKKAWGAIKKACCLEEG